MNSLLTGGLLPSVAEALDTAEAVVGASVSAYALAYAFSAPFLPIALGRFSRRAIMVISMALLIGGILLSAFAASVWTFYIARAVTGLATAAFTAQAMASAMQLAPPGKAGAATTWVGMGFAVAMALGVPVGTLLGETVGFRWAYGLAAAIGVIALAGVSTVRVPAPRERPTLRVQLSPFTSPSVLVLLLAVVFYAVTYFTILAFLNPILVDAAGLDGTWVAGALAIFGIGNIISMFFGGALIDRFGGLWVATVCMTVMAIANPLLGLAIGPFALVAIAAFGMTGSIVGPACNVELAKMQPLNPATVVGANMAAVQVGSAIGGVLGATLLASAGAQVVAFVAGPAALVGAVICAGILLARHHRGAPRVTREVVSA